MYADLCVRLDAHFVLEAAAEGKAVGKGDDKFRRILLNECQRCFERQLSQSSPKTPEVDPEAKARYKHRMLGNIMFVGQLLAKRMLASRVLLMISEELLNSGDEFLEALVALLSAAGPTFELDKQWPHRPALRNIFERLRSRL